MWDTDEVSFQSLVTVNYTGVIKKTWSANGIKVYCDVQDISAEKVQKEYGFTDANQYKRVFDTSGVVTWVETEEVLYGGVPWLIRLVKTGYNKMGQSNNVEIILSRVI